MRIVAWTGTLAAGLLGSLAAMVAILPLGLVVSEVVIYPLALIVAAVLASLGSGWAGTILARDGSRTRLLSVLGLAEATSAALAILVFALLALSEGLRPRVLDLRPIDIGGAACVVLALISSAATWRYRGAHREAGGDLRLTLALLALVVVGVSASLFVAALLGLTGA